ncbi:unnamed protein product [Rodentolepis nana]|uniref:RRM domain-containing protein n=1 Tax=Rodentolepis nana TaxID=102285 RepID=A0A0R3T5E6_RODNA|nr:unnamed protein product [Rodentolepis nana]
MYSRNSSAPKAQTLCVFNYPEGMDENDLYASFPNALSISSQHNGSSPSCLIKFQSDADCQAAYAECQSGKMIGGRPIQATLVPADDRNHSRGGYGGSSGSRDHYSRNDREGDRGSPRRSHGTSGGSASADCVLTLRNLAWSVTEDDLYQEFPRAVSANIKMDERNRSRGFGSVTFANPSDCRNAEAECQDKQMNGRQVRAEIGHPVERNRDDFRGGRGGGRPYFDRYNNGGGGRRGSYGGAGDDGPPRRRFDDVDGGRSSWGSHSGGGGGGGRDFGNRRGGFGGGGGFDRNSGRGGFERPGRERSPTSSGPVGRRPRGGPASGGARITSAVIRRIPGDSSDSDFDNRG